jgi:hypothetical protein
MQRRRELNPHSPTHVSYTEQWRNQLLGVQDGSMVLGRMTYEKELWESMGVQWPKVGECPGDLESFPRVW